MVLIEGKDSQEMCIQCSVHIFTSGEGANFSQFHTLENIPLAFIQTS